MQDERIPCSHVLSLVLDHHRSLLGRWLFDRLLWRAFLVLYREVLWLDEPALPGKNLIAVGRRAEAAAERAA